MRNINWEDWDKDFGVNVQIEYEFSFASDER